MGGVRGITLGPRFLVSQDSLKTTGLVKRGAQVTYDYRLRLPLGTDIAIFRKTWSKLFRTWDGAFGTERGQLWVSNAF